MTIIRQILADEINDVSQSIERYEKAIAKLEHQLMVKRVNLQKLRARKEELEEGADWL